MIKEDTVSNMEIISIGLKMLSMTMARLSCLLAIPISSITERKGWCSTPPDSTQESRHKLQQLTTIKMNLKNPIALFTSMINVKRTKES